MYVKEPEFFGPNVGTKRNLLINKLVKNWDFCPKIFSFTLIKDSS